ncbi:cullin-3B-like [Daucus carota subsp. sativus]|uniref:cullin-3B-like n=1 Tax=Daucus carota subsp. sativus TaxID=79200 RepID=UPI003082BCB3
MDNNQKEQNFKRRKVVDAKYAEKIWKKLEHAINEIYNHNGRLLSYHELYRDAYEMVLHNFGEMLYTGVESTMTNRLREISKRLAEAEGDLFLEEVFKNWVKNRTVLLMIHDILRYMDRTYIPHNHKTPVRELGMHLWRDIVLQSPKIKTRLLDTPGLVNMLMDDKIEDLRRMYNLFHGVPDGLSTMKAVMTSHLRETGEQLVADTERARNPVKFVKFLLDVKEKYDKIIYLAFCDDKTFQNAFDSSFESIFNLNPRSSEFISLFLDYTLRKGLKVVSEENVEAALNKIVVLLRFLKEKDVFEKYYKQHLAQRLLSAKTVSYNAERSLIVMLKTEFGYQFTLKAERMLADMITSQETMLGFYWAHDAELVDSPTFIVQVLTTGSWPPQPTVTCNLPAEMSALCEKFRYYYLEIHAGRRLSWQTNMGTAVLKAIFGKGQEHQLTVSTYQMCVLMMFNNADQYSYREIQEATEIPPSDLKRSLHSLACVEGKNVLKKDPETKDVSEGDLFSVNENFIGKSYKLTIRTVSAEKESDPKKVEIRQRVENNRNHHIDAAIVRIMKSRRVLDHTDIIAEVTEHLQPRFLADPIVIGRRIESLIEREYLERDGTQRNLYRYLA